ncbi:MAG: putative sigma-54 modulation protein [Gammaproteobacteria bacterium]|jgi:putative sigma-54 modulation protein
MQIYIQALNMALDNKARKTIETKLGLAFKAHEDHIFKINVRLADINGSRGGKDKCCRLQVVLPNLSDVFSEYTQTELAAAIDFAADRACRSVACELAHHIKRGRSTRVNKSLPLIF